MTFAPNSGQRSTPANMSLIISRFRMADDWGEAFVFDTIYFKRPDSLPSAIPPNINGNSSISGRYKSHLYRPTSDAELSESLIEVGETYFIYYFTVLQRKYYTKINMKFFSMRSSVVVSGLWACLACDNIE